MELSANGLSFLIELEGAVGNMYNDNAGHCTIGVGHLIHIGNCVFSRFGTVDPPFPPNATDADIDNLRLEKPFIPPLTASEIRNLLIGDKIRFEYIINERVTVTLNQHQFDALISFSFNIGAANFGSSTLVKLLNQGKYAEVSSQMRLWTKSKVNGVQTVNPGLIRRRSREADLFDNGQWSLLKRPADYRSGSLLSLYVAPSS